MIAQSQSGTGKTAAFALTILSRINYDLHAPQVNEMCQGKCANHLFLLSVARIIADTDAETITLGLGSFSLSRVGASDHGGHSGDG